MCCQYDRITATGTSKNRSCLNYYLIIEILYKKYDNKSTKN
jgi:hypothetical protein